MEPTAPGAGVDGAAKKKILLVVDDDEATLESLNEVLEGEGYTVITAIHGRDALDYLETVPAPDLAIIDLMMPVMDGWALATELRQSERFSATPVVIISAGGDKALSRAPVAAGYLSKPLDLDRLLEVVRRGLRLRPERSEDTLRIFSEIRSQRVSTRRLAVPIALAVGLPDDLVAKYGEAAAYAGAVLKTASLEDAPRRARELRPVALVVPDALYVGDGAGLGPVAESIGARLIRLASQTEAGPLAVEARIRAAVQASGRFR